MICRCQSYHDAILNPPVASSLALRVALPVLYKTRLLSSQSFILRKMKIANAVLASAQAASSKKRWTVIEGALGRTNLGDISSIILCGEVFNLNK